MSSCTYSEEQSQRTSSTTATLRLLVIRLKVNEERERKVGVVRNRGLMYMYITSD